MKQVDAYRKLSPDQRKRREAHLSKQLDKYSKQFLAAINDAGSANPGLLKNGAEALIEVTAILQNSEAAYVAYNEMVNRSRKVPVVPGLATLVDRLLELPTSLDRERAALLNWRITTGTMRLERRMQYLSERAQLTGEATDWKELLLSLQQQIKKGSLKPSDELVVSTLNTLFEHKIKLGEKAIMVSILHSESLLEQNKPRESEKVLEEVAIESNELPEEFFAQVEKQLKIRREASWELHQLLLMRALDALNEGRLSWSAVETRLDYAMLHKEELFDFLIEQEVLPREDRLSEFLVKQIIGMAPNKAQELLKRWRQALKRAGVEQPAVALALLDGTEGAQLTVAAEQPAELAETPPPTLAGMLSQCSDEEAVRKALQENIPQVELATEDTGQAIIDLGQAGVPKWVVYEAKLWLMEQLFAAGEYDAAEVFLDEVPVHEQEEKQDRWTRFGLMLAVNSGDKARIEQAFAVAKEELGADEAASLVEELGGEVPPTAQVEDDFAQLEKQYDSLVKEGAWQVALDLIEQQGGGQDSSSLVANSLKALCDTLAVEKLLPAAQQITKILGEAGDDAGQLELIKLVHSRGGNGDGTQQEQEELQGLLDKVLAGLCDRQFEPAVQYRAEAAEVEGKKAAVESAVPESAAVPEQAGEVEGAAARSGLREHVDKAAVESAVPESAAVPEQAGEKSIDQLEATFAELLQMEGLGEQLKQVAEQLGEAVAIDNPERAAHFFTQVAQATGDAAWAQERLDHLKLSQGTVELQTLAGSTALKEQDYAGALTAAEKLIELGAGGAARELAEAVINAEPESRQAQLLAIRSLIVGEPRDLTRATNNLLDLLPLYQSGDANPKQDLAKIKTTAGELGGELPDNLEAKHLLFVLHAMSGEMEDAAELVPGILEQGVEGASELLSLFERLALQDTDLPTSLILAWGRALMHAGRLKDALDRLAGLRDAVSDYPDYTALLEEIKEAGGGPGASMQLAEAYLRVNQWHSAAEEYASAMNLDESLAEVILTQLQRHSALDPKPNKYPLHLIGLNAVALSSPESTDWGWALSALTWLMPRWSAEELYTVAQKLLIQMDQAELEEEQKIEMLLDLHSLASKLGVAVASLDYLCQAWERAGGGRASAPAINGGQGRPPSNQPELVKALRGFDQAALSDDPQQLFKLHRLELELAVSEGDSGGVASAARMLAETGGEGHELALAMLAKYQKQAKDSLIVLLTRLELTGPDAAKDRQELLDGLLAITEAELSVDRAHAMIRPVLDLVEQRAYSPELQRLLMQLLRKMGDLARAWQHALWYVCSEGGLASTSMEVVREIAADSAAIKQQVGLIEIRLLRGEYEAAASALERLDMDSLDDQGAPAASLAEALLGTPAKKAARAWLAAYYRQAGIPALAADHLVWAHVEGNPQPDEWLQSERSGDLLYRSAQLLEAKGDGEAALESYERARKAKTKDNYVAASVRVHLANLARTAGNTEATQSLLEEALKILPDDLQVRLQLEQIEQAIISERIDAVRKQDDNAERTLSIAGILRSLGKMEEAISELQDGIGRGQHDPEIYLLLAECFADSGEYTISRSAFKEVLGKLESEKGATELKLRALYGLASIEEMLANTAQAIHHLEQLLVIKRGYLDAKERLELLYGGQKGPAPEEKDSDTSQILDDLMSLLGAPDEQEDEESKGS
ncbi:hypothetical protein IIA79_02685 [bacterium]|nr:hypothetical protein [bacterium]